MYFYWVTRANHFITNLKIKLVRRFEIPTLPTPRGSKKLIDGLFLACLHSVSSIKNLRTYYRIALMYNCITNLRFIDEFYILSLKSLILSLFHSYIFQAGYTATQDACGWAGAILVVSRPFGRRSEVQK